MDRVYTIDEDKILASLKEMYDYKFSWEGSVDVHIDAEEKRLWFDGISMTQKPYMKEVFFHTYQEVVTDENDLAFLGKIIDIRNDLAKQIIDGIEKNIETYNSTLEQIDKDTELCHEDNALATAVQEFQNAVADYLGNENIGKFSWGTDKLAEFTKSCVHVDNGVSVSINGLDLDIDVISTKTILTPEYAGGNWWLGKNNKEMAEEIVGNADYFLTQDKYILGADTLYELALDVVRYDDIVKQIEGAKDSLAVAFVKVDGDKDKLLAENDLYFEWFKDTFGHSFGKEGYDDEAMLNHRFAQMVEDSREPKIENIAEIKAPLVITAYSMTLIDKANEIKELIDNCAIRSDEKGRPNIVEIWSDINDRGDNVGNIRIVNGGEAIKLSYEEQECTGAYYNDHIFQKNLGEWKPATEVFDTDGMKKPLYDIFSHLLQPSEFNPRLADDEVKNQNRNKSNNSGEEKWQSYLSRW